MVVLSSAIVVHGGAVVPFRCELLRYPLAVGSVVSCIVLDCDVLFLFAHRVVVAL